MHRQQFLRTTRIPLLLFLSLIMNLQGAAESAAETRKASSADDKFDVFFGDTAEFDIAQKDAKLVPEPEAAQAAIASTDNAFVSSGALPLPEVDQFSQEPLRCDFGNLIAKWQIKFKPETFWARNANLLNNHNAADFTQFARSTLDINFALDYGEKCYGYNIADFFVTIRNKCNWGNPESIARTTLAKIKTLESLDSGHMHFITKQIFWIREVWFNFNVNHAMGLTFNWDLYFMLGAFPFELGRGIALGAAYAVNPGFLGFFSDNTIDQYAFGYKLNAEFVPDKVSVDLYGALLQNKGDSFNATGEKIYGQEYGRLRTPARGPGHVDFVIATRLKWFPVKADGVSVAFEPYLLYNNNPEQMIEFLADANVRLGTAGLSSEMVVNNFEFGFDSAVNFGHQRVHGWDRNVIDRENRQGIFTLVNSSVVTENPQTTARPPRVVFAPGDPAGRQIQLIIDNSARDNSQNGLFIGNATDPQTGLPIQLYNDLNRFRNPYTNQFKGWMIVADGAYWLRDHTLRFALGVGVASGDNDPNFNNNGVNKDYKGFVGLQEIYTGDRLQSVFLLGGAGRIPRPLTTPSQSSGALATIPTVLSGFTNLVFTGGSLMWVPRLNAKKFTVRPNILAYWQQHASHKFDIVTKMHTNELARNYLGTEVNTFFDISLLKDLKLFVVGSVFVPGGHYTDIKGTPLNRDQQRLLDLLDPTGFSIDPIPLLGDDTAYTINFGLEYRF